jgi:uncharacterized RDD family membrane protein YckC
MSEHKPPDNDRGEPAGTQRAASRPAVPRWVKVLGIVLAALLVALLLAMLMTGGQHGPGRHQPTSLGSAGEAVPGDVSLVIGIR